jgi:hypothetical protein
MGSNPIPCTLSFCNKEAGECAAAAELRGRLESETNRDDVTLVGPGILGSRGSRLPVRQQTEQADAQAVSECVRAASSPSDSHYHWHWQASRSKVG